MKKQDADERDEFFDPPSEGGPDGAAPSKHKKTALLIASVLSALLIAAAGFLAGWYGQYWTLDPEVRTYLWAKSELEKNYYRPVDEAELYERLYDTLSLDDYTELFTPEEYDAYEAEGAGQYAGIGIGFVEETTSSGPLPRVFILYDNSPAERAGVRKGMYLCGFGTDENSVQTGSAEEAYSFISAQKGSFVLKFAYSPDGSDGACYPMKRESYRAAYCSYRDSETSFRFRGSKALDLTETHEPIASLDRLTAYIRLDEFSGNGAAEFISCLNTMKERGRKNLILDLRTNGGGYLDILGEISSCLLRNAEGKNPVVAVAKFRDGGTTRYAATANLFSNYFSADSKVYVLADEYTASASECLIGALIDYGTTEYGQILLRADENGVAKTYGKGIMQSHITNVNGSALKLTVATIHWPLSDRCIHGVGITSADGAVAVRADLIWGKEDPMLEQAALMARG